MSKKINVGQRKSVMCDLNDFCYLSRDGDFMELTEWTSGDGFDLCINERHMQITWGQFKALKSLVKELKKTEQ